MNIIWCIITGISILVMIIKGQAGTVISTLIGSGTAAVDFCLKLAALNCVWCGIIKLAEDAGAIQGMSKIIGKPIKKLFGKIPEKAAQLITISLAANIAGLSGAATPAAVNAISELDKTNDSIESTYPMTMLFVINSCGLSILPATVIGMRAAAGARTPADIVLPNFLVTIINTIIGILLVKLIYRKKLKMESEENNIFKLKPRTYKE